MTSVSESAHLKGFNLFYDFFWHVIEREILGEAEAIKFRAKPIFGILGGGDAEKGYTTLKAWHEEIKNEAIPTAPIHIYDRWRPLSDEQRMKLEQAIEIFDPPFAPRPGSV